MIKVKIERDSDSVFYVEDGVTVQYADDVLEIMDLDDAVIAVFRGWVYALPITEEEYLTETGQAEELDEEEGPETAEVDFVAPEMSLSGHGHNHVAGGAADDETAEPAE